MQNRRTRALFERFDRNFSRFYASFQTTFHSHFAGPARVLFAVAGLCSFGIILLEFGFYYPVSWNRWIQPVVTGILWYLIVYEFISFLFTREAFFTHIQSRKIELMLAVSVLIQFFFKDSLIDMIEVTGISPAGAVLLFLAVSQILFLINNIIHLSRKLHSVGFLRIRPSVVFTISFTLVILTGFLLLSLPRASNGNVSSIDLFFTSVSATCVTGLSTIMVHSDLTIRGQLILMILIQIGGLGLMTLTSFFSLYLAGRYSLSDQLMMRELLSEDSILEVKSLLKSIGIFTFVIELAGAFGFYFSDRIDSTLPVYVKIFQSLFHSISAFCNAGFSLYPDSLVDTENPGLLGLIGVLIMLGGIGFPIQQEIRNHFRFRSKRKRNYSTGLKLVILTNLILWFAAGLIFFLLEKDRLLSDQSTMESILHSFFFAVTTRTAGFESVPVSQFHVTTVFFALLLMWIGASPVSTGGGIKTTTIALSFLHILSIIRGSEKVEVAGRTIQYASISRAYSTVMLSLFVIFTGIFTILLFDSHSFLDITFEVVSAFGTVGLSRGITPELSNVSRLVICAVMLTGRVGVLTVLHSLIPEQRQARYDYPGEYIITG